MASVSMTRIWIQVRVTPSAICPCLLDVLILCIRAAQLLGRVWPDCYVLIALMLLLVKTGLVNRFYEVLWMEIMGEVKILAIVTRIVLVLVMQN